MMYKHMAEYITDEEVEIVVNIVKAGVQLKEIKRHIKSNFIEVIYCQYGYKKEEQMDLLPDDVYIHDDNRLRDGRCLENGEVAFRYRQFMIARGYSDYWMNNPYERYLFDETRVMGK